MSASLKQRAVIFFLVILFALAFLAPTLWQSYMPATWISKPISLGLDLKGGVHLLYRVEAEEAVKSRLQSLIQRIRSDLRDEKIAVTRATVNERNQIEIYLLSPRTAQKAQDKVREEFSTLRFVEQREDGERIKLTYEISELEIQSTQREAIKQAVETLRNRVDQFGVAEPLIQQVGTERIMLQMPGISDIEGVKKIVGKTAKLEFRLVPPPGVLENTTSMKDRGGGQTTVEDQALMTGDAVDSARVSFDERGQVEVLLSLTSEGSSTFYKITRENVGRQLAIILDGVVYSAPVLREPIAGGQASISGGFTMPEASQLALVLRSGALPAPLTVLEERTVGPTLGQESIRKGAISIAIGFAFIAVFMVLYYGKSGFVAVSSLVLNLFLLLAGLSAFGATLTLPGIAGLALTAGMAVDSNVIIFERIRDELRNGSTRDAAVSAGFDKALSAIIDSNLTTLLSGFVLYGFGSGPIRGFAVTLCLGVLSTIYTATFVSRLAFDYFSLQGRSNRLSI